MTEDIEPTAVDGVPTPGDVPTLGDMPMLGFGTWELDDPSEAVEAVSTALDVGFRHVDTAQAYDNENAVGDAIEESPVDRDEIYLATKIWIDNLDYETAKESTYESLDRLDTDYVDLLYVHWPAGEYDPDGTLQALDELVTEGAVENLGVANFEPDQLETAVLGTEAEITAHQFEYHPLLRQDRMLDVCEEHDVHPVAYSPLARGNVEEVPTITDIAAENAVSAAQVSLAWLRQRGIAAIPKATSEAHIHDDWESLTLRLSESEMAELDDIEQFERQVDPSFAPWNS
ncbi:MAG: aldo/keto reductase [Halodesulfurarchaeum sp.]